MTAAFNPHAARSRWFTVPLADVTPRERALLDELAGAVAWAEEAVPRSALVRVGSWDETGPEGGRLLQYNHDWCQPVYVVREAR